MKKIYLLLIALVGSFGLMAQDLLISGVFDGPLPGGNPKGVELYVVNNIPDLSIYGIGSANNGGGSDGEEYTFSSISATAGDYIYVTTDSAQFHEYFAFSADFITGSMAINGDDAVELFMNGSVIDVFGDINTDGTGQAWEFLDGWAYRVDATGPDGSTFVLGNWFFSGINTTDGCATNATCASVIPVGTYSLTVVPEVAFKTDSFEFNEGDGAIHLDSLLISPAIASPTNESFEIHLDAASTATPADFNVTVGFPVTFPYTYDFSSPLSINFTSFPLDATLVDDALIEGTEWFRIILRNGMNGLNVGADSSIYVKINDNDFPVDTFVALSSNMATVSEGAGSFDIALDYQQTGTNASHTVDLMLVSGDVADVDNFATMTATFNTLTESFTVNITDDLLVETDEVFTFALTNATNGLLIGSDSIFTLTIEDNDVPEFDLGLVDGNDATGGDSTGLYGRFTGVVNSLDRGFNAIEFSMQDATGSVDVFSGSAPFSSMTVALGDEVVVQGTITFFNGMVRIENLDSMSVISTGNTVTPVVATAVTDANESDLIRINELTLVDPAQWAAAGGAGFDVFATDPAGDTVMIRIDRDYLDLYDATAPNSSIIDVIGVASQYDAAAPYDEFHQIIPRDLNDIILYPTLNFADQGSSVNEDAGTVTVNFAVANDNGGSYTVDVELTSGDAADLDNFATITGVIVNGGIASFDVTVTDDTEVEGNEGFEFTVSNPSAGLLLGNGTTYELTVVDNDADAIEDINVVDLKLYPNPASKTLKLEFISNETQISTINIVDVLGRVVSTQTLMLNNGRNNLSFDVSSFAKGNYVMEIATEKGTHTENVQVK